MFKSILLPVDLAHRDAQQKAIDAAASLTRAQGASLTVISVIPDFGMAIVGSFFPDGFEADAQTRGETELAAYLKDALPEDLEVEQIVVRGTIYEEILCAAEARGTDLIVMGAHRPELRDYLLGPNAARVARHAKCSVIVVRG